ncbi:MAG: DUF2461 domain-containing protein [Bacteroidota bacterium]
MVYFQKDFIDFFKELAANNNKDWFDTNRKRYENIVREPFKLFIGKVIDEINKDDSAINLDVKDAIFRINRDIRFSKDKTPYKLHVGAIISPQGRKDKSDPGIYIELNPEHLGIFGGAWTPDKVQLDKIRKHISSNQAEFKSLISNKVFLKHFPEGIKGEKNKRLPKELVESSKEQELIFNKQFYYQAFIDPREIIGEDLLKIILNHYFVSKPINDFLKTAINNN